MGWLLSHAIVLRNFDWAASGRFGSEAVASLDIVPESGIFFVLFALTAVVQAVTCAAMYVLREQLPLIYTE